MLFGLEVVTGVVSVAAVRLWAGVTASLTGNEFVVSRPRYLTGVLLTITGGVLYGVMLWADRVRGEIRIEGSVCPNCGTQTELIRRRKRHRILSLVLKTDVTRQNWKRCGGSGLAA